MVVRVSKIVGVSSGTSKHQPHPMSLRPSLLIGLKNHSNQTGFSKNAMPKNHWCFHLKFTYYTSETRDTLFGSNLCHIDCPRRFCPKIGWRHSNCQLFTLVPYIQSIHMGVSKNRGTPKWMVYEGKPYQNWWFGGYPYFWKHPYESI